MKLTILGTGNATVTECYNTCFAMEENGACLLVDGGGGNTILQQLKKAGIDWKNVRDIFVTHKHIDHLLGIIWMVRLISQSMHRGQYDGEARIYAHRELLEQLEQISHMLLQEKTLKVIGKRLHFIPVEDGQTLEIMGHEVTFFDIQSTKAKQFGFSIQLEDGKKLTCCGDEPYNPCEERYAVDSTWLMHEAFCLYSQADKFKPYEKNHSTVKDACELAEQLGVANLILYHTEDKNIAQRQKLYLEEGAPYFSGKLYVPEDLDTFEL